jgi:tRNA threonylcarbamoyladenosine modification (KEOPS) complex  Pcc1 subunit
MSQSRRFSRLSVTEMQSIIKMEADRRMEASIRKGNIALHLPSRDVGKLLGLVNHCLGWVAMKMEAMKMEATSSHRIY